MKHDVGTRRGMYQITAGNYISLTQSKPSKRWSQVNEV